MPVSTKRIEKLLSKARVGITNAMNDPEIKQEISKYGYDDARLQEGLDLYNRTNDKVQEQSKNYGDQFISSNELKRRIRAVKEQYMDYRKLARKRLWGDSNEPLRKKLGIDSRVGRTLEGFLDQARQFYENAINDKVILENLARFAITAERLKAAWDELETVKRLDETQESKKGEAQQSTKERDALYKELKAWMSEYDQASRIALKSKPQLLEKLGIRARS